MVPAAGCFVGGARWVDVEGPGEVGGGVGAGE